MYKYRVEYSTRDEHSENDVLEYANCSMELTVSRPLALPEQEKEVAEAIAYEIREVRKNRSITHLAIKAVIPLDESDSSTSYRVIDAADFPSDDE